MVTNCSFKYTCHKTVIFLISNRFLLCKNEEILIQKLIQMLKKKLNERKKEQHTLSQIVAGLLVGNWDMISFLNLHITEMCYFVFAKSHAKAYITKMIKLNVLTLNYSRLKKGKQK